MFYVLKTNKIVSKTMQLISNTSLTYLTYKIIPKTIQLISITLLTYLPIRIFFVIVIVENIKTRDRH